MSRIVKNPLERRDEIVQAAKMLFQASENVTLQDVMNKLGIAKGTIYHYFKSKEELLEAVVEEIIEGHVAEMEIIVQKKDGTALEKIRTLVRSSRKTSSSMILNELHKKQNEALHTRLLVQALMKQAPLFAELIQQGCLEGIFETDHPLESAEFILTAMQFLTDRGIHSWTDQEIKRRKKALPRLIEVQLHAPPGSFKFMK